ncbi:nitroreductase family protein [Oscillospiraceae bacterium HV4-5-C5C]|nr:nitroreductase family protein [Oscillospiraceae bacterium HV4-5-C5C]
MNDKVLEPLKNRHSVYALGRHVSLSDQELGQLIEDAFVLAPTAFNNQATRAVILLGEQHVKLWDLTEASLRTVAVSPEAFAKTQAKLDSFRQAYGTVLYFIDTNIVHQNETDFPLYAANFHDWAEQGLGGAQLCVWTALSANGLGASLQHYNPLIDAAVAETYDLPAGWQLRGQMPFGSVEAQPEAKPMLPASEKVRVLK